MPPLLPSEVATIAYPDMLMFQPFGLLYDSADGDWVTTMMMNRDVWMAQYSGWDGLFDSALFLLEHSYLCPHYFQYISGAVPGG